MGFVTEHDYQQFARKVKKQRAPLCETSKSFLNNVRDTMVERDISVSKGHPFFRAQKEVCYREEEGVLIDILGCGEERMLPRLEYIQPGRCNQANQVVLYLATTEETAVSELRPWIAQDVSIAIFKTKKELKLANVSKGYNKESPWFQKLLSRSMSELGQPSAPLDQGEIDEHVWYDIDMAFSNPVTRDDNVDDYAPTQILAELIRNMGYDGLAYKSKFGEERGYNIVLFDIRDVEISGCRPVSVKSIEVQYENIGNVWNRG